METKISKEIIKKYLKEKFKTFELLEYKKLGKGWHGSSYKLMFNSRNKLYNLILRTKNKSGFSHDYKSDRASCFILAHEMANSIQKHSSSLDVVGVTKNRNLVSLGACNEFFQLVEAIEGTEYMKDLERIKDKRSVGKKDKERALILSNYLVNLHKNKFKGNKQLADSIYKRHLRDCIGHGEMLLGVIDTYPKKIRFSSQKEITNIIKKCVELRENIKNRHHRLCSIHGDFHPGNIFFQNDNYNNLIVLDASREMYGDPADDLTAMAINYIWFALKQKDNFSGHFKELFEIFWKNYIRKANDKEINKIAALFFAFRGTVVAHPLFYKGQSNKTRRKIFNFINNVLEDKVFNYKKINSYIE